MKKDIQLVDALSDVRQNLLQRMSAIENLDKYRSVWIKIMEDLSSRIPSYLWLSGLREEPVVASAPPAPNDRAIPTTNPVPAAAPAVDTTKPKDLNFGPRRATIDGYCYSINSLAAFLINLTRSNYFKNVELKFIRSSQQDKHKFFAFQLGCDLIYYIEPPSFAKAEQGTAQSAPVQEAPVDQAPADQKNPTEPEEPGQTQLDSDQPGQTLAQKSGATQTESQKIIP